MASTRASPEPASTSVWRPYFSVTVVDVPSSDSDSRSRTGSSLTTRWPAPVRGSTVPGEPSTMGVPSG